MLFFLFKTLHIIGFVAWFGGLFYLVRILVYHQEAKAKSKEERAILVPQYELMEQRVIKIIAQPAMMFTWTCGIIMLVLEPAYLQLTWLRLKLIIVLLLSVYHLIVVRLPKKMNVPDNKFDDLYFRILNEIPTILLAIIAALAVFKTNINYFYLATGILLFIILIGWGIIAYRKKRESSLS